MGMKGVAGDGASQRGRGRMRGERRSALGDRHMHPGLQQNAEPTALHAAQGLADRGAELNFPLSPLVCLHWFLSAIRPYFCMCIGSIHPIYSAYVHLRLGCAFRVFLPSKSSLSVLLPLLSTVLPVSAFDSIFLHLYMSMADFLGSSVSPGAGLFPL